MGKLGDVLSHPAEIVPLVQMYAAAKAATRLPQDPDLAFCYQMLTDVSRSFAIVIQQLPNPLRDAIAIFYLVLRALDTIEDDMAVPEADKVPQLLAFYKDIYNAQYTSSCGYNHYKRLMSEFPHVARVFLRLQPAFQSVIADITRRMGAGMAEFISKEVRTLEDYDLYCHYVAGLVGIGLSDLFASSQLESAEFGDMEQTANHMGLFLQKTNIIRDYLEDINEEPAPRMFWPREVWGQYANSLDEFKQPSKQDAAVKCLNQMVTNALQHLPRCVEYMSYIRNVQVFRFCAIPQIMAAGTLSLCYNNGQVFTGVVKMRRGTTAVIFQRCEHMGDLYTWFIEFLKVLQAKADTETDEADPTLAQTREVVASHLALCREGLAEWNKEQMARIPASAAILAWVRDYSALALTGAYAYYAWGMGTGVLPDALQPYSWVLKRQPQLHQALSFLLLLVVLLLVVSSKHN